MVRVLTVAVTTNGSGAATGYTPPVSGLVRAITYVPHASTPLDTNADIVVTGNTSGMAILTKANIGTSAVQWHPRAATAAVGDGSALLYASGGTSVCDLIPVGEEAIKIVVSSGDNTKSGTFYVFVDGA
uniref:Uncharacterized protein n=1 Tax=viral metagenome TaxID=1070528 RepID=A0A6M3J773_9ZZZZ